MFGGAVVQGVQGRAGQRCVDLEGCLCVCHSMVLIMRSAPRAFSRGGQRVEHLAERACEPGDRSFISQAVRSS